MKAMIFAAGLGTRLRPLTNYKPKALVEVNGKTLLELSIKKLTEQGFDQIIINVHHFADQVIEFLSKHKFNARVEISDERNMLLETGGGLKKAKWFFDGTPFLVYNVDIVSDIDLYELYQTHLKNRSIATLAVRDRISSRYFLFDDDNILCGWENIKTSEKKIVRENSNLTQFAFSGIHVIDPKLFEYFPDDDRFSIIDVYLHAAKKEKIKGFIHNSTFWKDVGSITDLNNINTI